MPRLPRPAARSFSSSSSSAPPPPPPPRAYETLPAFSPTTKTIATRAGALPASPLMDPAWRAAQGFFRAPKPRVGAGAVPPAGRFQRLLSRNAYARLLATPVRLDPTTDVVLPRAFLATFGVVGHPLTGKPWWTPLVDEGPGVEEGEPGAETEAETETEPETQIEAKAKTEEAHAEEAESKTKEAHKDIPPSHPDYIPTPRLTPPPPPSSPSPSPSPSATVPTTLRVYTLLSGARLSALSPRLLSSPRASVLLAQRRGPQMTWLARTPPVWRHAMAAVYLRLLRDRVLRDVDLLLRPHVLGKTAPAVAPFVAVDSLADLPAAVPPYALRCAVLWFPPAPASASDSASPPAPHPDTFTFPNVKFNAIVPVHNMQRLLGSDHISRLYALAPDLQSAQYVLLVRPMALHLRMRLWQLEGFLRGYSLDSDGCPLDS